MVFLRAKSILIGCTILLLFADVLCQNFTESTTQSVPVERPRSLRLPNTTYPLSYHLHISSNIHLEDFKYNANVTIHIQIRESTNEIILHAKNLSDFMITVRELTTGALVSDLTHSLDTRAHYLIIHPIENYMAFEAGQEYSVEILYKGVMHEKTNGIYWLTYSGSNNQTVYLAATQFEPTSARLAFPCYDEPAFKSNFTIRITHGSNYMAISNMQVQHVDTEQSVSENLSTTTFYTTPPMSTYLVAFIISDFVYISEEYRGVTQRIFTSPETIDKGHKALKNAVQTVAALEDYFGINYPLAKLDHIALQKNYGAAMENWGLITYKEDNLVYQDDADIHKKLKDILTQNHEIVHQWFGNLVSPKWWTYAWMNEGFATYFAYIVTDLIYPEHKAMEFFLTDIAERAYSYSYIAVRPITYYVEKESEILSIFDIITYQRAACIIKMFHHAFNQQTFIRGINRFLRKFQYVAANELQLFDELQTAVAEDSTINQHAWSNSVRDIMLSWTHSEWIPIVSVRRNYDDNTITIQQRSKDLHTNENWWIPLNFATASKPDFEHTQADYFMPPMTEVTLSPETLGFELQRNDWLLINKQQTGFYHVLYDDENLMAIAKQLQENHTAIHPLNRAAIFQDLCPLIENNQIHSVDVIFELLKYLQYEEDLIPWNLVADTIGYFERHLFGTESHALYKQFIQRLIAPIFHQLFQFPTNHANLTNTGILTRQKVLDMACNVDLPECLDYTRNLAHDYIFRGIKFQADMDYYAMHDSILCLGLKYLSDKEFNAILEILSQTERNSEWYDDLIYSLRCTQSRPHLRQYLNLLLGENSTHMIMNDSESMMYLFYLYKSNMAARPVVWHFFESNYQLLCRSPFFVENFNRIAEYIPQRHRSDFLHLRQSIWSELKMTGVDISSSLITDNSPRIGKKMILSELFLQKFGVQINDWLMRDIMPSTYAASIGARNTGSRFGLSFKYIRKLFQKLAQVKF